MMENFQKIILKSNNKKKRLFIHQNFLIRVTKINMKVFFSNLKFNKFSISIEEQIQAMNLCFQVEELL